MSATAFYAAQSDPDLNRHFRRRWAEALPLPRPLLAQITPTEPPAMATLLRWRDEWRGRQRSVLTEVVL